MKKDISTIDIEDWGAALNFIEGVTKLKTIALEFDARLIDEELSDSDEKLLFVHENTNGNNNQLISLFKNSWLRLGDSQNNTGKKILTCNLYTSRLIKIGEVKFLCNLEGSGKVMLSVKSEKVRNINIESLAYN